MTWLRIGKLARQAIQRIYIEDAFSDRDGNPGANERLVFENSPRMGEEAADAETPAGVQGGVPRSPREEDATSRCERMARKEPRPAPVMRSHLSVYREGHSALANSP